MSAEHYWARLAPAHAKLERGSSSHDKVTPADVAGALSGMPAGPFMAGLVYLTGDDSSRTKLITELVNATGCSIALARAALFEMDGGVLCQKCNGRGSTAPQVVCDRCLGRRKIRPTQTNLATLSGVSRATWYRHHSRRYESVFATLENWLVEAQRHVARELRA